MSGSSSTFVRAVNVRKSYGATEVLRGVNLTIDSGEVVVLVGPSGAGQVDVPPHA